MIHDWILKQQQKRGLKSDRAVFQADYTYKEKNTS